MAAAIMIFLVFGVVSTYFFYLRISLSNPLRIKAALMSEEGIEALKFLRDEQWSNISNLSLSTDYYLQFDGADWNITPTPQFTDPRFERKFAVENVNRDTNGNIVPSGGTLDGGTKKIIMTVSWRTQEGTTTKNLSAYLTNIFND